MGSDPASGYGSVLSMVVRIKTSEETTRAARAVKTETSFGAILKSFGIWNFPFSLFAKILKQR